MGNESEDSKGALGLIPALRARIARYREQADHFTRLADAANSGLGATGQDCPPFS